jgi:cytochrome P450
MVIHPDVQKRAQDDLDRVVGATRLPLFSDRKQLPYIDCIVWECLRLNPVAPLSLARTVTEDDEYRGFHIPKGTTVLPNAWYVQVHGWQTVISAHLLNRAILHDENVYPDAHLFKPERFADREKNALAGLNGIPDPAFGFGRRMCPGRWVAFEMLWITVASLLSVYNFRKALDENGLSIEPVVEYTSSALRYISITAVTKVHYSCFW